LHAGGTNGPLVDNQVYFKGWVRYLHFLWARIGHLCCKAVVSYSHHLVLFLLGSLLSVSFGDSCG